MARRGAEHEYDDECVNDIVLVQQKASSLRFCLRSLYPQFTTDSSQCDNTFCKNE